MNIGKNVKKFGVQNKNMIVGHNPECFLKNF